MTETITGRARHLGPAAGLVRNKADNSTFCPYGKADLYQLTPPLRGYTTVMVTTIGSAPHLHANGQTEVDVETLIFGLEGDDLIFDSDDVGGGWGIATHADALTDAGYHITEGTQGL
jgi:hypothetical protein